MNCPHCDTHIDEHEASRCLDAWIAEAVMDEILTYPDTVSPHDSQTGITMDVNLALSDYSTDISAAWEVACKLREKGILLPIWDYAVKGKMPLAICREAIRTVHNAR